MAGGLGACHQFSDVVRRMAIRAAGRENTSLIVLSKFVCVKFAYVLACLMPKPIDRPRTDGVTSRGFPDAGAGQPFGNNGALQVVMNGCNGSAKKIKWMLAIRVR